MTFHRAAEVADLLREQHYLGPIGRGLAWRDERGALVIANPTARRLPQDTWAELVRWCILGRVKNAGSQQWAAAVRALRVERPELTTIVSYSDPSQGHTGALYRACNWLWAPTWHRLRPPLQAMAIGEAERNRSRTDGFFRYDLTRAASSSCA